MRRRLPIAASVDGRYDSVPAGRHPDYPCEPLNAPTPDNLLPPPGEAERPVPATPGPLTPSLDGPNPFLGPGDADGGGYDPFPAAFGEYRRGEVLHQSARGFVCRCEGGPPSTAPRVIKVFRPSPGVFDPATVEERATAFLARAELQRRITLDQGARHWAAVHAHGRLPGGGGAYAVADFLPRTARSLAVQQTLRLKPETLSAVVDGILGGLFEIRDLAGRGHASLGPDNVLLTDLAGRKGIEVRLTDPAAEAGPDADAADLRAVGALIHELVLHQPVPRMFVQTPDESASKWDALGAAEGRKWRGICDKLLYPGAPQLDLDALEALVRSGRRPRGRTQVLTPEPRKKGTLAGPPTPKRADLPSVGPGPETTGPAPLDAADDGPGRRPAPLAKLLMLLAAGAVVAAAAAAVAWKVNGGRQTDDGQARGGGQTVVPPLPPVPPPTPEPLTEAEQVRRVDEQLRLADAELSAGRFDGALAALGEAREWGRKSAEVERRARVAEDGRDVAGGRQALDAADLSAAHELADRVLAKTPSHPGAADLRRQVEARCKALADEIDALVRSGQPEGLGQARDRLRTLLLQAPWYPGGPGLKRQVDATVAGWVAQADRDDGARRFDEATAGYAKALTVDPDRPGLAEKARRVAARARADVAFREAVKPAEAAAAAGDWRRAADLYAKAAAADPANETAKLARTRLVGRIGQLERDAASLEAAGQLADAAAAADSLLARDPGNEAAKALKERVRAKQKERRAAAATGGP